MKGTYTLLVFALLITMIISPLGFLEGETADNPLPSGGGAFTVKLAGSDETVRVPYREYVIGVLAGEMSPDTEPEALKAQAVAAYTYALWKQTSRDTLKGYDVSADPKEDQCWLSTTEQVALWQESYDKNRSLLEAAVDEVLGYTVTYGGKPILAAYHSVSSGKTESAASAWGSDYPYLINVESAADLLSPEYLSDSVLTTAQFADKALDLGITLVGEAKNWLGDTERSETGAVISFTLAGKKISGADMRTAFSLASRNFDLAYADGKFTFTVRGSGHGVGMSQYGAVSMASEGSNWMDILSWYYPGTDITPPS